MAKKLAATGKPLAVAMRDLIVGHGVSQLIYVAAKLGLADLLNARPKTPAELARSAGADPRAVHRVLRALASEGVFAERKDGRFALTPLAATLRSDRPHSMRAFAMMMVEDYNWQAWGDVLQSVMTGRAAFDRVHGARIFDYLGRNPDKARVFGEAMTSISATENSAVVAACDFSKARTVVDVGGSHGHLLAAILRANPKLEGVLFDVPQVLNRLGRRRTWAARS